MSIAKRMEKHIENRNRKRVQQLERFHMFCCVVQNCQIRIACEFSLLGDILPSDGMHISWISRL